MQGAHRSDCNLILLWRRLLIKNNKHNRCFTFFFKSLNCLCVCSYICHGITACTEGQRTTCRPVLSFYHVVPGEELTWLALLVTLQHLCLLSHLPGLKNFSPCFNAFFSIYQVEQHVTCLVFICPVLYIYSLAQESKQEVLTCWFLLFLFLWDRISLCSSGWPGNLWLKIHRDLPVSAHQVPRLKVCTATLQRKFLRGTQS